MTLEVTETAAMTDVGPALENLARLRMRGFGLSIDDFGTGFASMQQLGRIAFSELKIDRGFVSAMADTRQARAIVESSIDMARRLGITAVAEGIETQAEWDALRAAGCTQAQGYFVSRPVAEADFVALCAKRAA
jgi:EAL domain-containing protein (putative c-di-GMP-specific phosphodiesterase class I)